MQHNIRSGLSCLHEQGTSYTVLYGGYAAPNRLVRDCEVAGSEHRRVYTSQTYQETVRWLALVLLIMKRG